MTTDHTDPGAIFKAATIEWDMMAMLCRALAQLLQMEAPNVAEAMGTEMSTLTNPELVAVRQILLTQIGRAHV